MDYGTVRSIHIACAVVSITLFTLRGVLQLAAIDWRRWLWLRVVPHMNDTVLLVAAVALAIMSGQYPLQQPWLTAKVVALFVYIGLGSVALRRAAPAALQRTAFVAALITVGYIVGAAWTRSATLRLFQ